MQTAFLPRERVSVSGVGIGLRDPHVDELWIDRGLLFVLTRER